MLRTRRRWWLIFGLSAALVTSLSACGAARVESVARETALELLNEHVAEAVTCLTSMAAQLDDADTADLAARLSDCGNTALLNKDDDQILEEGLGRRANVFVSGAVVENHVVLHIMTTGMGHAQAGVATARVSLVTCWQVTIDREAHVLTDHAASACNEALLVLYRPSEQVLFSDLQVPDA